MAHAIVVGLNYADTLVKPHDGGNGENTAMRYSTREEMAVGDDVLVDGMSGVIVCDFRRRLFADGYESWDRPTIEMLGGGTLSSGVMVNTKEAGLVHYGSGNQDIMLVRRGE